MQKCQTMKYISSGLYYKHITIINDESIMMLQVVASPMIAILMTLEVSSMLLANIYRRGVTHGDRHVMIVIYLQYRPLDPAMDKLKLTGQIFNSRLRRACICHAIAWITKWPNLKLKTRPKQLLGSLLLAFVLPDSSKV